MLDAETCRTVLEILPHGIYVVDHERRILFWNDGAEQITGYHRHEVIGRHCQDNLLMDCDARRKVLCGDDCPLQATMHDGRPREADVLLRHRNGERVPVRVRSTPLRDPHGTIIGAVESFEEPFAALDEEDRSLCGAEAAEDELTGLEGRQAVEAELEAAIADHDARHVPCGVLSIAIDRLDQFQHSYGVLAAEALVRSTAHTLARNLCPRDGIGRWSEDRFVAVLRDHPEPALVAAAERLRQVAALAAISWWGDRISATISAGVAVARPGEGAGSMVGRAEAALQRCREEGGDRVAIG